MRIRKNAKKLSPLLFSSSCAQGASLPVETHVCQLNQSPWDVIPFDSDSIQFEPDDSFAPGNNNNNGDSFGAVESVASLMDSEHATTIIVDNNSKVANGVAYRCQGLEDTSKGWACKNEAREGQAFCEHHLSLSNSYSNKKQAQVHPSSTGGGSRRGKTRGAGKKTGTTASSNPYEFYYYSGFGPSWGKRRGDRNGEESKSSGNSTIVESENAVGTVAGDEVVVDEHKNDNGGVEMENEGIIDYEDDDEEEENDGKKRMRKPVKARSLKSLM